MTIRFSHGKPAGKGILLAGKTIGEIYLADHISELKEGNWIKLSGGFSVNIPAFIFKYGGPFSVAVAREGKRIDIRLRYMSKTFRYPINTHQVYYVGDYVTATFYGNTVLGGQTIEARLIKVTLIQIWNIIKEAIDKGNIFPLRRLLEEAAWSRIVRLNSTGDISIRFKVNQTGDYILTFMKEEKDPYYKLYLYSFTLIKVLENKVIVKAPFRAKIGDYIDVNVSVVNGSPSLGGYIYTIMMVHDDAYKLFLKLITDGRCDRTTVTVNDALLLKGVAKPSRTFLLFGVGLDNVDKEYLLEWIHKVFGVKKFSIVLTYKSGSSAIIPLRISESISPGKYIMLIGVWDVGKGLVALSQRFITLVT